MIDDITFCIDNTKTVSYSDFCNNELLVSAICFKFVQISENSRKISKEFQDTHKNIEWIKIVGLRNRIVHEYGNVQLDIIYDTVKKNLPSLLINLSKVR